MRASEQTDAELLGSRDPETFALFYRRHVRMVIALVGRRLPAAEVGDVVAEVFAAALVGRRRFDPRRGSAAAWLAGIARRKVADAQRRGYADLRLCRRLGIAVPPFVSPMGDVDDAAEVLCELPEEQRRAVSARVLEERSYAQIAAAEAASEQVIRQRVSRGLRALRARLKEER